MQTCTWNGIVMTYTFKLARRLALAHMALAGLFLAACSSGDLGPAVPTLSGVQVLPDTAVLTPAQKVDFSSSGRMNDGSATPIDVRWSASGGTIDANGVYSAAAAPGTYRVVARSDLGYFADTSMVLVAPPGLKLVVVPASLVLAAGSAQHFTAYGRTPAGDSIPVPVTYRATGGSVADGGLYTAGGTPGTFRVIAALPDGSIADTADVTLVTSSAAAPSSASAGPNEPSGFTRLAEHDWSTAEQGGWYHDGERDRFRLLSESGAGGPRRFMRAPFFAGDGSSTTPVRIQKNIQSAQAGKLYWSFWLRISPNFQGHPTGTNKVNFAWMRGSNILFLSLEGVDAGPLTLMPRLQTHPTSDPREYFAPNQGASGTFSRGVWHRIEMLAVANTGSDRNGRIAVWLDGVKIEEYRDIRYVVAGEGHTWDYVDVTPLWGGGGGVVRQAMNMDYGPMYLSSAR
jgi:hypothetical protein